MGAGAFLLVSGAPTACRMRRPARSVNQPPVPRHPYPDVACPAVLPVPGDGSDDVAPSGSRQRESWPPAELTAFEAGLPRRQLCTWFCRSRARRPRTRPRRPDVVPQSTRWQAVGDSKRPPGAPLDAPRQGSAGGELDAHVQPSRTWPYRIDPGSRSLDTPCTRPLASECVRATSSCSRCPRAVPQDSNPVVFM